MRILLWFGVAVLLINCLLSSVNADGVTCSGIVPMKHRDENISIADFGGVGDGVTLNTKAFREAIYRIRHLNRTGGALLYIPSGEYLTGPFNLTSRMTLYLARGAVLKATVVLESPPFYFCLDSHSVLPFWLKRVVFSIFYIVVTVLGMLVGICRL